jgi:hypothetical protein
MPSSSRRTLNAARYFLRQTAICGVEDHEGFAYNSNAVVVFGRSVTWHLQKEYANQPGYDTWYSDEQTRLKNDRVCNFFKESRTTITHRNLQGAKKVASVAITAGVLSMGWLVVKPTRAQPWYRRSPRTLWQDALLRLRRPIDRLRLHLRLRIETLKARRAAGRVVASENFYFDHPDWETIPALNLLNKYLDALEGVVDRAEGRFGIPSSDL